MVGLDYLELLPPPSVFVSLPPDSAEPSVALVVSLGVGSAESPHPTYIKQETDINNIAKIRNETRIKLPNILQKTD